MISGMKHDARTWVRTAPTPARPYGWSCPCGATGKGFKSGAAAKAAAVQHNGGHYDQQGFR